MKDIKQMGFWETVRDIPNRIITLVWKLLSVKGVALALAVALILNESITEWEAVVLFLFVVLMIIGGREAEKWKRYFIEMKNGGGDG